MKSLRELYRIGKGPSSSHTMGPQKAAQLYLRTHPVAKAFHVTLYGSLAATGKGHMTDVAIREVLESVAPVEIAWKADTFLPFHPNGVAGRWYRSRKAWRQRGQTHGRSIPLVEARSPRVTIPQACCPIRPTSIPCTTFSTFSDGATIMDVLIGNM